MSRIGNSTPECFHGLVFVIASALAFLGCETTRSLSVQSQPDGVEIHLIKDRASRKIGITPIVVDSNSVQELFNNPVQIQVIKEGFKTQSVFVPKVAMGGSGTLFFNMEPITLPQSCQAQAETLNEVAKGIANVTMLIQQRRLDEASSLNRSLILKYNDVAVLHEIEGNIYYLQKNFSKALESYRKSNSLLPQNTATLRMIQKLEQMLGSSNPGGP